MRRAPAGKPLLRGVRPCGSREAAEPAEGSPSIAFLEVPANGSNVPTKVRFSTGGLDARAGSAAREEDLIRLGERFIEENRHRWAARHTENVVYRLAAFHDALAGVGVTRIDQFTAQTLARYAEARHAAKVSDATINRTIQVARAMARWASKRSPPLCDAGALAALSNLREVARNRDPLIPSPREWKSVIRELEREECPRSTANAIERTRANARGAALLVAVAVQTGLRFDELRHIRAEDIGNDVVSVRAHGPWRPKDREERDVAVTADVAALAREFVAWRDHAVGLNGHALVLGGHWIEAHLSAAWERAKLPGAPGLMHDARRTFATEMSHRPGVSVRDVQRLLGHADLETTQRYLGRYRSDDARTAVDMGLASVLRGAAATVVPRRPKRRVG